MFTTSTHTHSHVAADRRSVTVFGAVTVSEGWAAVVTRHGRQVGVWGPGRHRVRQTGVQVVLVPTTVRLLHLPLQEVPTADGITVRASVAALVRTTDPAAVVRTGVVADGLVYLAIQVALRELVASLGYEELLATRSTLAERLLAGVAATPESGVTIERTEVRDLVLPAEVRRARAAVLVARAEGQAALERARGETAALRSLTNAARLAEEHPALLQMRMLQHLEGSPGHTIVVSDGVAAR